MVARQAAPGLLKIEYIIYMADDKIAVGGAGLGQVLAGSEGKYILTRIIINTFQHISTHLTRYIIR